MRDTGPHIAKPFTDLAVKILFALVKMYEDQGIDSMATTVNVLDYEHYRI